MFQDILKITPFANSSNANTTNDGNQVATSSSNNNAIGSHNEEVSVFEPEESESSTSGNVFTLENVAVPNAEQDTDVPEEAKDVDAPDKKVENVVELTTTEETYVENGIEYKKILAQTPDGEVRSVSFFENGQMAQTSEFTRYPDGQVKTDLTSIYENGQILKEIEHIYGPDSKIETISVLIYENGEKSEKLDLVFDSEGKIKTDTTLIYENGTRLKETTFVLDANKNVETISTIFYENDEAVQKEDVTFNSDGGWATKILSGYGNNEPTGRAEYNYNNDGSLNALLVYNENGELAYNSSDKTPVHLDTSVFNKEGYLAKYDGNSITIEDETGETAVEFNLDKLLEKFDEEKREHIVDEIKKLPPEVLVDLYNENVPLDVFETHECENNTTIRQFRADYHLDEDKIYMREDDFNARTLTHELGHAIDCTYEPKMDGTAAYKTESNEGFTNSSTSNQVVSGSGFTNLLIINQFLPNASFDNSPTSESPSSNFLEIFNEEKEAFMKETGLDEKTCGDICYGSTNPMEAFAESYTFIMLDGLANTDPRFDLLQRYFPKTIFEAGRMLKEKRTTLSQELRGKPIEK